ncbi:flippase-like domain-containing protein [Pseudomonas putida]|uniref:Flippase-like domain-containing protein n=1 Tax=Pseudomonas putida TaxID=303 RepID=A0A7W2QI29_PSEPU|nr:MULTISPECIES: lysylphosphatidylglycerol synthase transmembrane domain-containing protein [Pseudomonas]MBA6115420.1 flippase-like domain-containing protein [Pseudomonas putida]MBI6943432.1 flippase-like domain-containing protein [Pseudomonas putida]MBI6956329.1 flippase-like domain-containing protein [Pseudomonas putida]MCZ9636122.1 flippase-like domain-containing protein [Pseudomonas putida]MEC4876375.1 flippase-like domain-containing protein [Pseudomonas sp. NC26]
MNRLGWLGLALLFAVLVPTVLGGNELLPRLKAFDPGLMLILLGMILTCWVINAIRLRLLLGQQGARLGHMRSLGVVMATEFAICTTPGGSGGPLALMALLARDRIGPARSGAVFAMDQLNDLVFFFCAMLAIAGYALFHSLGRSQESMLLGSALLLCSALAVIVALLRYRRAVMRFNGRMLQRVGMSERRKRRWARKLLHFIDALAQTWQLPKRTLALVFTLTCAHWSLRYSVLYLVLRGLGVELSWIPSFLVQMLSLSAGQFSLLPGGAGAAELTSASLLSPLVGSSTAAAAILIWRAVTYYFYLLAGGPVFVCLLARPLLERWRRQTG